MSGIPSDIATPLMELLTDFEQFETNRGVRDLFAEKRIKPWRNNLPQADTILTRVAAVISYLHDKKHRDGSNALVLMLIVLANTIDQDDYRYSKLKTLTSELAAELAQPKKKQPIIVEANKINLTESVTTESSQSMVTSAKALSEIRKIDFFISYNRNDKQWAEWIAWQLENAGYTTIIQAWDFRPGGNFVADMQEAAMKSERTIAVLSPTYLASQFTQPEWNADFARDPTGKKGLLVPVKVQECDPQGLLSQIVYIDLTGLSPEQAIERLLTGVKPGRTKPPVPPDFPLTVERAKPSYPGNP
jgi:hypothetical protein